MSFPQQAIILAGGKGTRLLPLTLTLPKPMIEFHGKPFLQYLIEMMRNQGIKRILLLLGYLPEKIMEYFGDGSRFGINIQYSISPVEDETGTRLLKAMHLIDDVFFFMYCDNYLPVDLAKMWDIYQGSGAEAMVTVYSNRDNYSRSNLRIGDNGRITVYDKTRNAPDLQGVDLGFMFMTKRVLTMIPAYGNPSFEKEVYPHLVEQRQLHAFVTHHRYYSVGDHGRLPITKEFLARKPAVLLDRDGVLNKKMPKAQYVRRWKDWQWLDGALESIALFTNNGYRVIIISNQAGIAFKALTVDDLDNIHAMMLQDIERAGGHVDSIYYCPHHWDAGCFCRKPEPGMLFMAQRDFHIDLSRTYFVGDDERDGIAAERAGCLWKQVTEQHTFLQVTREIISETEQDH